LCGAISGCDNTIETKHGDQRAPMIGGEFAVDSQLTASDIVEIKGLQG